MERVDDEIALVGGDSVVGGSRHGHGGKGDGCERSGKSMDHGAVLAVAVLSHGCCRTAPRARAIKLS